MACRAVWCSAGADDTFGADLSGSFGPVKVLRDSRATITCSGLRDKLGGDRRCERSANAILFKVASA